MTRGHKGITDEEYSYVAEYSGWVDVNSRDLGISKRYVRI